MPATRESRFKHSLQPSDRNPICELEKAREESGDRGEENSMCFWLIWHFYLRIRHRCFLLFS